MTKPEGSNFLAGWLLSVPVSVPSGRRGDIAIKPMMEFSGNYWRQEGRWVKVHTLQAGARLRHEGNRRFLPFGQFLVGGAFVDCCDSAGTHLSIEPGFGVDVGRPNSASKIRIAVGFPILFGRSANLRLFRVQIGSTFYPDTL